MAQSHEVTLWNLLQLRAAIKMEKVGMRHSSGRSARKKAALSLGLKANTPHDQVIEAINTEILKIRDDEMITREQESNYNDIVAAGLKHHG
jgi:hypothetical protein